MAYVYRHIRLDKNQPFYIGIGNDDNYARANTIKGRNLHWKRIVDKTNYDIEILIDGISWELACQKEIEFISIYKRVKDGGTLCNITLGGEGKLGVAPTNAFIKGHNMSPMKGKKLDPILKEKMLSARRGNPRWKKRMLQKIEGSENQLRAEEVLGKMPRGPDQP